MDAQRNAPQYRRPRPAAWGWIVLGLTGLQPAPAAAQGSSWEIGYSFPAPSSQTNGLTWDGEALWHTNERQPIIYRLDPNGGAILNTISTTNPDQGDLEYAGGYLWVVSELNHFVYKVDPASGKALDSIKVLGIPPNGSGGGRGFRVEMEGCTFDGRNLWLDGGTSYIVRIDLTRRTQHMYLMPPEMGYLDGLTWAFDHLWVVTNNATIYELDPCTMGVLDRFDAPANVGVGPEGFAFDGENLWFADNERDEIYKIILKDKILTKRAARSGCNEGILITESAVHAKAGALPARAPGRGGQGAGLRVGPGGEVLWTAPDNRPRNALGRHPDGTPDWSPGRSRTAR